ncbi:MAG: Gfo/Idh/MocA family oxidoreductase [Ruminococcaceae bacterium]|nr:Gfo/Idh/MocA family oxidoreductase [Oscillospiraceae bacterium]
MKHKIAIIGYGGMGSYHVRRIMDEIDSLTVVGVFDLQEERMALARANGLIAYESLDALLADPQTDLVLVATPNDYHKDLSIRALRSGKNVVCEKPVTLNAKELEEILAVARETGKVFTVHQNRRWDKDFVIVKNVVDNKLIGTPYVIESRVQGSKRVLSGWRGVKRNGGGMLLDWGVHMLDQIMWMIKSPVVSVYAELFEVYSNEVDDNCRLHIHFENGIAAMIQVDTNCFINQARWHVMCTDGTLIINDWSCNGKMVRLLDNKELEWTNEIVYTEAGPTRTMAPRPRETTEEIPIPQVNPQWSDFYNNVCSVIEDNNNELIVKPEEALRVMKVIDALFESAKTHSSVECNI